MAARPLDMRPINDLQPPLLDGRQSATAAAIARGVRRHLWMLGFASLTEFTLPNGRRADVTAISDKGEIWIVEIKSSVADFRSDQKWPDYRDYCDRLLFAVHGDFPAEILPEDAGFIVADAYGAAVIREAPAAAMLNAGRRKMLTLRFARIAATRMHALADPEFGVERLE
jgi:hypothetical protein